jgi:hypothetical protein
MPLVSLVFLFVFSACETSGMKTIDISERVKFCFNRTDPKFDKLQSFLKAADAITYSISGLKASDKSALCSVIVTNNELKDGFEINTSGDVLRIFISDDLSGWEKNYKTQAAVISAMLLGRFGIKPDLNYERVPAWMHAGVISRIETRRNPSRLTVALVYQGVRGLISGGAYPDLWCILNNPLEYRDGPAFTLYSEICAIIIDSIARNPKRRDIFLAMLKSSIGGEKPDNSFKIAISDYIIKSGFDVSTLPLDQLTAERRGEIWFGTVVRNTSLTIFFPGSSDYVEKRLDELITFKYIPAAAAGSDRPSKSELRSCEIYELGKKWNEMENPERIANIYGRYFSELSNQSSPLVQNEVNKIFDLFNRLKDNDKDTFERDLKDAVTKLREKTVKLRLIEDYLRESEGKFIPLVKMYAAELKYLEESGAFIGQFCPSLNSILDKEERHF